MYVYDPPTLNIPLQLHTWLCIRMRMSMNYMGHDKLPWWFESKVYPTNVSNISFKGKMVKFLCVCWFKLNKTYKTWYKKITAKAEKMLGRYVGAARNTGKGDPVLMTNVTAQPKSPKKETKHKQVGVNNKGWFKCGGHVTEYIIQNNFHCNIPPAPKKTALLIHLNME